MCAACPSVVLSYGFLMYVVLNIKNISRFLSTMRDKRKKYFLCAAGLATFTGITTYIVMS